MIVAAQLFKSFDNALVEYVISSMQMLETALIRPVRLVLDPGKKVRHVTVT
jgi:hypothetical protein